MTKSILVKIRCVNLWMFNVFMKVCHATGIRKTSNMLRTSIMAVDSESRKKTNDFWEQGAKNTIYGGLRLYQKFW